jgi:hypothetical protein
MKASEVEQKQFETIMKEREIDIIVAKKKIEQARVLQNDFDQKMDAFKVEL